MCRLRTSNYPQKFFFLIGQVPSKIYGSKPLVFVIQHIETRKSFTEVPPPPRDQTIFFAYSCTFTFHTTYKNVRNGHGGGGDVVKCSKTKYVVGTHKNCVYLEYVVYCMQI